MAFLMSYNSIPLSFLGGTSDSIAMTCTPSYTMDYIKLTKSMFGDLYGTSSTYKVGGVVSPPSELPNDWDTDTIIYAKFNTDTHAGNVNWDIKTLTGMFIMRKELNTYKWIHLYYKKISRPQTAYIRETDVTPGTSTYQYAIVPLFNGVESDDYIIEEIDTKVSNLCVVDRDGVWYTALTDGAYSINYNMPSSTIETLNSRYPTVVRNNSAKYKTVSVNGQWLPVENGCQCYDDKSIFNGAVRNKYEDEFWEWLHNGYVKLLKLPDGRLLLGFLTTPASISVEASTGCVLKSTSFEITEIGNYKTEYGLYNAGLLINIPEKYILFDE